MRNWMACLGVLGLLAGFQAPTASAAEHGGGKAKRITGEVVDVACYVKSGARGGKHKECAETCAKAGGPLGILQSGTNRLYLAVSAKPGEDPRDKLMEHISHKVQVNGTVAMRSGVSVVAVQSVKHLAK